MTKQTKLFHISNDDEYQAAKEKVRQYTEKDVQIDEAEQRQYELLALLVKAYEIKTNVMLSPFEAGGFYRALRGHGIQE